MATGWVDLLVKAGFRGPIHATPATRDLAEVLLLAVIGAGIGTGQAWAIFNGTMRSTGGIVFRLAVTPALEGVLLVRRALVYSPSVLG